MKNLQDGPTLPREEKTLKKPFTHPLIYKYTEEGTHVPESELLRRESSNHINLMYGF